MKLSFSTRGWKELPWPEQVKDASELRFQGIEVYNLHKCPSLTDRSGVFHKFHRNETLRELREHHLTIPCLDTCIDLGSAEDETGFIPELIDTAATMKIPYVAVCALHDDDERIRERIDRLIPQFSERTISSASLRYSGPSAPVRHPHGFPGRLS